MAIKKGSHFLSKEVSNIGIVSTLIVAGIVTVDGTPAERTVIGYNTRDNTVFFSTVSDPVTGAYSLPVRCGPTEEVRVICLGAEGENSMVLDHFVIE